MMRSTRSSSTSALALLSCLACTRSTAQQLDWFVLSQPALEDPAVYTMNVDPAGNLYTAGAAYPGTDMDPGPGVAPLAGSIGGAFVRKMDTNGIYQWCVTFEEVGPNSYCGAEDIRVDALGNIIIVGSFQSTIDFDPSPAQALHTSNGGPWDSFVCKLDPAGNFLWVAVLESTGWDTRVTVDPANNIWVGGFVQSDTDFDPGPGDHTLTLTGDIAGFLWKLDPAGNYLWAGLINSVGGDPYVSDVATNANGDLFAAGWYGGTVDLDPGPGAHADTAFTAPRHFVLKLHADGELVWVDQVKGEDPLGLAVDGDGNVLASGYLSEDWGPHDFDPGPGVYELNCENRVPFLWKLSDQGDLIWARQFGDSGMVAEAVGVVTDPANNVIITGRAYGGMDLDPGPGSVPPPTSAANNFISVLDPQGEFIWGGHITHGNYEGDYSGNWAWAPATDALGNIYVGGYAWGTIDVDPGPDTTAIVADALGWDGFPVTSSLVVKLTAAPTVVAEVQDPPFMIYPIPVQSVLHIATDEPLLRATLLDMSGRPVRTLAASSKEVDLHDLPSGPYVLDVLTRFGCARRVVIKQ
jgi:hypothetical protein